MVTNTKDAPKNGGDKADKVDSGVGGSIKAWIPLTLTVVLVPVLAFAVTKFVVVPELQKGCGIHTKADDKPDSPKTDANPVKQTASINKLLTNVGGDTMAARYLLTSITLSSGAKDFKSLFEQNESELKDVAIGILRQKTLVDLQKPGAVNTIRSELITSFNIVLGENVVSKIHFTEFAVQ